MPICFSLTDLKLGGAQVFVVRLACELAERSGKQVFIYDHWPEFRHPGILQNIHPLVKILSYSEHNGERWLVWKINALLAWIKPGSAFRHRLNRKRFGAALKKNKIGIINSHMADSDFVTAEISLPEGCQLVLTLHGEYELLLNTPGKKDYYTDKIRRSLLKSSALIYTAEKNLLPVQSICPQALSRAQKISIGFNPSGFRPVPVSRGKIGLTETDFVIGMVSRGILAKGWDTAIRAVELYNQNATVKAKLVCIGNGDYLKELVSQANNPDILLLQFEENFQDYFSWYAVFDLFIFPSRFEGESLPNVIIESLYWQVPVLASGIAEIPAMLGCHSEEPAGICVDEIDASHFAEQIGKLVMDRKTLSELKSNCRKAFVAYDMAEIAGKYESVFNSVA